MAIIGRQPPADIIDPGPDVSGRHAEIVTIGGGLYSIRDLGSANGTFVNGQRIQECRPRPGDRVSLGRTRLDWKRHLSLVERRVRSTALLVATDALPQAAARQGTARALS